MSAYETIEQAWREARISYTDSWGRLQPNTLLIVHELVLAGLATDDQIGEKSLEYRINQAVDHALTLTDGSYYDDETITECICEALGFEVPA